MGKKIKKIGLVGTILFIFILQLCIFPINVNALSDETTGFSSSILLNFTSNHNKIVSMGGYIIYAIESKLLFYDSATAELIKTLDLHGATLSYEQSVIGEYNDTCLIWCEHARNSLGGGSFADVIYSRFVNINTLAYSTEIVWNYASTSVTSIFGLDMWKREFNNVWYCAVGLFQTGLSAVFRITNTSALIATTTTVCFNTSTIVYQSEDESNIAYAVSCISGYEARISKIDIVAGTITVIGTTGMFQTYGDYVYLIGHTNSTDGISTWQNIGLVFTAPNTTQNIIIEVIKFNDTSLSYEWQPIALSSEVNDILPFSVSYSGIWTNHEELQEGYYQVVYASTEYVFNEFSFLITDLTTDTPFIGDIGTVHSYQGKSHYYSASTYIGGLQDSRYNVGVMIDYDGQRCIADVFQGYNPEYGYVFDLSPTPLQIINSGTDLRAVCYQSQDYFYYGEVFLNGIRSGNGTYTVQSTGLSTDYYIDENGIYGSASINGSIINGLLNFTITGRISSYDTIYEGIKVNIAIGGGMDSFIHKFVWTTNIYEDGLPHVTPIPTPIPDTGSSLGFGMLTANTLVGLMLCLIISIFFGFFGGRDGLLTGLMIAIFVCSISGLFPIWGIIFSIIIGALAVLSHTGIPNNNGGS